MRANGGVDTEASYSYNADRFKCRQSPANKVSFKIQQSIVIPKGDENALTSAIVNVGPSQESFVNYKGFLIMNHNAIQID